MFREKRGQCVLQDALRGSLDKKATLAGSVPSHLKAYVGAVMRTDQ